MFSWFKKSMSEAPASVAQPLRFKDSHAAFAYACEFLQSELTTGEVLPAIVLDAKTVGGEVSVKRQPDGIQMVMLRVCSKDNGYMVIAATASNRGPELQPGDLVAWQAGAPIEALASQFPDPRSKWGGLILAKLLPEYTMGIGWAIEQPFGHGH
jgi:hypothetical protein